MSKNGKSQSRTRQRHAAGPRGLVRDKSNNPQIIVIVGPTASGKSDLAVQIALRLAQGKPKKYAEIISADSRQVYRGMDIGTGKITQKEMRGIPHYLLDVVSPKVDFSVSRFKEFAAKKIEDIVGRDKVPIIVGGTGFWVDVLIYDWPIPEVVPNRVLRERLEKLTVEQLFTKLKKLDPARAATIDRHNPRRLIRALEIIMTTGKTTPEFNVADSYKRVKKRYKIGSKEYEILILGTKVPQRELERRIYIRLLKRLDEGMIQEIKKLHQPSATIGGGGGVSWKRLDNFGLEYRYVSRYLRGLLTYDQMFEELYRASKNYAKRQMRWFKRNPQIKWSNGSEKAVSLVKKFIY